LTPRTAAQPHIAPLDQDTEVAIFTMIHREYEQMTGDDLGDEVIFERMKQICYKAYVNDPSKPNSGQLNRLHLRRSSDPHRKKREAVYSKGLVRISSIAAMEEVLCGYDRSLSANLGGSMCSMWEVGGQDSQSASPTAKRKKRRSF
jgi:hypothetical protein